ncbi:hypothetical protein Dsin_013271 [Dipteronia sinensis]|uniref:Uncharacterized protein n=1 Tax=Dipteronia sinensis TaxID=43782 RepID=A0AAE0AJT9_9ROSI|nr:hypothetical protein Dsin_013271 [Dipteronia sinensis]
MVRNTFRDQREGYTDKAVVNGHKYSNRQRIVNNKATEDVAGNVLLVTIEGTDPCLVNIDCFLVQYNCLLTAFASKFFTPLNYIIGQLKMLNDAKILFGLGIDGKKLEPESNILVASIENMQYAATLDLLNMGYKSGVSCLVADLTQAKFFNFHDCPCVILHIKKKVMDKILWKKISLPFKIVENRKTGYTNRSRFKGV